MINRWYSIGNMSKEDLKVTIEGLTLGQLVEVLKKELQLLLEENRKIADKNLQLQDEVDTLWTMMETMTKSDKEAWLKIVDELDVNTAIKGLMVVKKKADC